MKTYAIHPAIGIARLGNAEVDPADAATYYLGPEAPYQVPNHGKPYKDGGRIKKQAQRFRIYEFEDGKATREITLAESDVAGIEWTVHLSNRKAALNPEVTGDDVSTPAVRPRTYGPAGKRNEHVPVGQREDLCIDPGPRTVREAGAQQDLAGSIRFPLAGAGEPRAAEVTLGKIYMEPKTGRLLVFAGNGLSRGLRDGVFSPGANFGTYANSDGWYDDSSDGRVQARIIFDGGRTETLDQPEQSAWVLCTVPRYAPALGYFTTLHDAAMSAFFDATALPRRPSFRRDIYPILRSVSRLQWVSEKGALGHSPGKGDYLDNDVMQRFAENDPSPTSEPYRRRDWIFRRIRNPDAPDRKRARMPSLPEDVLGSPDDEGIPYDIAAVTPLQYAMLKKWRDGDFDDDFGRGFKDGEPYVALDDMDVGDRPAALDLGALDGSAGTPFFPGIESWCIIREKDLYAAPLRFHAKVRPGDLTIGNALPWQADYLDCNDTWWPVQRPTLVWRGNGPEPWVPAEWEEGEPADYGKMVEHWWRLGFVVSTGDGGWFQEVERDEEGLEA